MKTLLNPFSLVAIMYGSVVKYFKGLTAFERLSWVVGSAIVVLVVIALTFGDVSRLGYTYLG